MFEQESYNNEVKTVESHEGDLFHNYEIKNWFFSANLDKVLVVSAILNLSILGFIGQTNLLTLRGCDSPFVGRVCQVLDMAYVGTVLFGTEREYADMEYEKTELDDAEITFIDVSNVTPPLTYPEGYFQLANPVQFAMQQQGFNPTEPTTTSTGIPGFPGFSVQQPNQSLSGSESELLKLRPQPPPANPGAFQDDTATAVNKSDVNGTNAFARKTRRGGRPPAVNSNANVDTTVAKTDSNTNTNTNPTTDPAKPPVVPVDEAQEDKFGVFINKRPLKDWSVGALEKIESKAVSLDRPFKVVIAGTLAPGKDGKTIILKDPKPVVSEPDSVSDPEMEKLVEEAILRVGDSGWFGYLVKFGVKKVEISLEQGAENLIVTLRSEQASENTAKTTASGLGALLALAIPQVKGDEETFLKLAKTGNEGKIFILNFNIPKPLVQEMVLRKLAESKEKENKPSGNAAFSHTTDTKAK